MASVTSLPELVTGITSVTYANVPDIAVGDVLGSYGFNSSDKDGSIDLAVGNLLGSNVFNILILALDDIFFTKCPILFFATLHHIVSGISAIAMTVIAIIGLIYRAEKKPFYFMAWDSIGIVAVYIVNLMFLYRMR